MKLLGPFSAINGQSALHDFGAKLRSARIRWTGYSGHYNYPEYNTLTHPSIFPRVRQGYTFGSHSAVAQAIAQAHPGKSSSVRLQVSYPWGNYDSGTVEVPAGQSRTLSMPQVTTPNSHQGGLLDLSLSTETQTATNVSHGSSSAILPAVATGYNFSRHTAQAVVHTKAWANFENWVEVTVSMPWGIWTSERVYVEQNETASIVMPQQIYSAASYENNTVTVTTNSNDNWENFSVAIVLSTDGAYNPIVSSSSTARTHEERWVSGASHTTNPHVVYNGQSIGVNGTFSTGVETSWATLLNVEGLSSLSFTHSIGGSGQATYIIEYEDFAIEGKVKVNDVWTRIAEGWVKVDGLWKRISTIVPRTGG